MILFAGGIQIYQNRTIPGTEIEGYDLIRQGEIFIAEKPNPLLESHKGLTTLVLGKAQSVPKQIKRVQSIIRGYEDQKLERQRAQNQRVSEAHRSAVASENERIFGTFGHG